MSGTPFVADALEGLTVDTHVLYGSPPFYGEDAFGSMKPCWLLDTLNAIRLITGLKFNTSFNLLDSTPDGGMSFGSLFMHSYQGGGEVTHDSGLMMLGNSSLIAASSPFRALTTFKEEATSMWRIFEPFDLHLWLALIGAVAAFGVGL